MRHYLSQRDAILQGSGLLWGRNTSSINRQPKGFGLLQGKFCFYEAVKSTFSVSSVLVLGDRNIPINEWTDELGEMRCAVLQQCYLVLSAGSRGVDCNERADHWPERRQDLFRRTEVLLRTGSQISQGEYRNLRQGWNIGKDFLGLGRMCYFWG